MTRPPIRTAWGAGALAIVLLGALQGGCARPAAPTQQASAAQKAACRQRADEVYAKQNRAELYESDTYQSSTRDSPFATTGLPGITTRGLGGQYERDNLVSDCLNGVPGNVGGDGGDPVPVSGAAATPGRLPATLSPLAVPPSP
jgi:hypothetical protein